MKKKIEAGTDLKALVMGELAAARTYREAREELLRIEHEHEEAAALLRRAAGQKPADAAERRVPGRRAPAQGLKEGERKGLHEYEEALRDAALSSEVKRLIRSRLLPKAKTHLPALKRLLQKSDR